MVLTTVNDIYNVLCNSLQEEGRAENISRKFSELKRNSDRVRFTTDILKQKDVLPEKLPANKCLERSLELRKAGNGAFLAKGDKEALLLYTKSIAAAPFPTYQDSPKVEHADTALAIAFANRAAVLFANDKYELCLRDISEALKYNYPNKLLYKLFERQGKCLHCLGKTKQALESITNALNWLPSATDLIQEKKQAVEAELQEYKNVIQNSETVEVPSQAGQQLPSCSYGKNHEILCASDCVELKYSPEMGRYISATRDILPGDVIAVEKPFASVLLPEYFTTHCYNCLQRYEALLPCCLCSNVMYCSEECRSSSWNKSHFIDCSLLSTLQKLEINKMAFLSLRIIIIMCKGNDLRNILSSLEAEENLEEIKKGFNNEGLYSSSEYGPIYWLVGNTEKRTIGDLFNRSVAAACILHCLETMTEFFSDIDVNEHKYEVGGLLLRHIQNLPCNAHEVSEMIRTNASPSENGSLLWENLEIGAAAYGMLSLINHSCDPNVVRHSYRGDTAVLRAIRPISAGEQVLDNYGYHYATHKISQRVSQLKSQYYFTCTCEACTEGWPTYNHFPDQHPTYLCSRCKIALRREEFDLTKNEIITCKNCSNTFNLATSIKEIDESSVRFVQDLELVMSAEGANWYEVAQRLIHHLVLLDKYIKRPWKEYNNCQETIKQCFAMTANYYKP